MNDEPGSLRVAAAAFAASLVINLSTVAAVEFAAAAHGRFLDARTKLEELRKQREELQFEFIESPPKTDPDKPDDPKKLSDRDALNQGLAADPSAAADAPPTIMQGRADQLRQLKAEGGGAPSEPRPSSPAAAASPASQPVPAVPQSEPQAEGEDVPAEEGWRPKKEEPRLPQEAPVLPVSSSAASRDSAPQAPAPAASGASVGADRITTQEMSRSKAAAAKLFGATSFEATGSGMGVYMKNLKERIWFEWFPYLAFQYPTEYRGADVVLRFTLDMQGRVRVVELVESNGEAVFADFCMRAVQKASPFGPIPEEMRALLSEEDLEIYFGFHLA